MEKIKKRLKKKRKKDREQKDRKMVCNFSNQKLWTSVETLFP